MNYVCVFMLNIYIFVGYIQIKSSPLKLKAGESNYDPASHAH